MRKKQKKRFWQAVAVMIGYIVGVGMFGLPFIVTKAGIFTFLIFVLLIGVMQYFLHLIYANIIVVTHEYHRLAGYAGKYLGESYKSLAFVAKTAGNLMALLAYLIIVGIFLNELLGPIIGGSPFIYSTLLFALGAVVVYCGIGAIARFELIMTGLLLLTIVLITWRGAPAVSINNFSLVNWSYIFLPYGIMLMALNGSGALPIVAKLLKKDKALVKRVVQIATLVSILVIVIFTLVVVGISGKNTSPDALVGLRVVLDDGVVLFSLIFGVLTITTSFLLVAESVKETLWWDYKVNKRVAWAIAAFVPYLGFLFGIRNLTKVVSFAGGVAGGLSAIILILIFRKLKKKKRKLVLFKWQPANTILYILISVFILGLIYEMTHFFQSF